METRSVLTTALGARSVWRKGTWRVKSIACEAERPFSCFCRARDSPRTPAPQNTGPAAGQNLAAAVTAPWVCLLVSVANVSNGEAAMAESCRTCGHLMTRQEAVSKAAEAGPGMLGELVPAAPRPGAGTASGSSDKAFTSRFDAVTI